MTRQIAAGPSSAACQATAAKGMSTMTLRYSITRPTPNQVLRRTRVRRSTWLGVGLVMLYLSVIVLIPLAAVAWHAAELGPAAIWRVISSPDTRAALQLSLYSS